MIHIKEQASSLIYTCIKTMINMNMVTQVKSIYKKKKIKINYY